MNALLSYENMVAATQRLRDLNTPEALEGDERVLAVAEKLAASDFGCQHHNVRTLVAAILGVDEVPDLRAAAVREFVEGAVISVGDSRYLVRALDGDNDAHVLREDFSLTYGPSGNRYVTRRDTLWRVASDEEIRGFCVAIGVPVPEAD